MELESLAVEYFRLKVAGAAAQVLAGKLVPCSVVHRCPSTNESEQSVSFPRTLPSTKINAVCCDDSQGRANPNAMAIDAMEDVQENVYWHTHA